MDARSVHLSVHYRRTSTDRKTRAAAQSAGASRGNTSSRHDRGNFNDTGVAPYVGCHLRANRKTLYRQSQVVEWPACKTL
jgi:hypothetical protein